MAKKKDFRKLRYLWLIAIIMLIAYLVFFAFYHPVPAPSTVNSDILAVINDTTYQIVWVGGGALCVPAAPNTHLVSDCVAAGNARYDCNGTYYTMSKAQINCSTS